MAVLFDAESIQQRIEERLRDKEAWQDILFFSANSRILDTVSEEIAYLASYGDYSTRETKWDLIRNRTSMIAQTPIHRYKAHRKISATGQLRVALDQDLVNTLDWDSTTNYLIDDNVAYSGKYYIALTDNSNKQPDINPADWDRVDVSLVNTVEIPKYSIFSDGADVKYTNLTAYNIVAGDDYVDIDVIQGIPRQYDDTATGIANEEFVITEDSIENTYIKTYINDVEWDEVDSLLLASKDASVFEIEDIIDYTGVYLKFGNNIFGKKLVAADTVRMEYIESLGQAGDILSRYIINTVESSFTDVALNPVDLFCANLVQLIGGNEIEDKESIRINAPSTFQTGDRASTPEDYRVIILNNFTYILKVIVWGVYEENTDQGLPPWTFIPTEENLVHISAFTTTLENLTDAQKLEISEQINQYKAPTDILDFRDTEFVYTFFDVDAYVKDRAYTLAQVRSNILDKLEANYAVQNREFFQPIRNSDYITDIDTVEGVDYHYTNISFFDLYDLSITYDTNIDLPLNNITPNSVKVYVKDTVNDTPEELIGEDDGIGGFTNLSTPDLAGSVIVYADGTGAILIDALPEPASNYQLRIAYNIDDEDIVLNQRNQIIRYEESYSTVATQYTKD